MSELLILGTSAGISTANRHHFSIAIKRQGRLYVIDCGAPVSMLLKQMGEDPKNIETLFLTHWHPDHASGLPMLIQDLQLTYRKELLQIYGPAGTSRKVEQLQNMFILAPEMYPYPLETIEYDEQTLYERDGMTIEFFKTRHLAQDNWRMLDERHGNQIQPVAYGLVVHIDGKKIVVSGDIFNSDDLLHVLPGTSLVIHEFGHIDPEKLHAFVIEQQISNLLITHIHHEWTQRQDELKQIISAKHSGRVEVAQDLMRIDL